MAQQQVLDSGSPPSAHAKSSSGFAVTRRDLTVGLLLFFVSLTLFWLAPMRQVTDSRYSLLLSQSLLEYRTFRLDNYKLPREEPFKYEHYVSNGSAYQIQLVDDHFYYFFPVGGPILSVPFVKVMNLFGLSVVRADGTYNFNQEILMQGIVAAIVMAAFAMVLFLTARYLLSTFWSIIVSLSFAFGSQILSTTSRGIWSDTWALLLLGIALFVLVRAEVTGKPLNGVLLGTVLAWAYICRPTYSLSALAIAIYVLLYWRSRVVSLAITAAFWFAGFIAFSYYNFHQVLPSYYNNRLRFSNFFDSLAGNLFSPSRGLFVCVPITLFILFLTARYWRFIRHKRLAVLAFTVIPASIVVLAGFVHWWGGHSFGARLTTGEIPWFALLAILSIRGFVDVHAGAKTRTRRMEWSLVAVSGVLLLSASVFINLRGATSQSTWAWNEWMDETGPGVKARLWNWRSPQFLAGLVRRPFPENLPSLGLDETIDLTKPDANKYLFDGWSGPEPQFHWTDGPESTIAFATDADRALTMRIELQPFLAPPRITSQKISVSLNGEAVAEFVLTDPDRRSYEIELPKRLLNHSNVVILRVSNPASPWELGIGTDMRKLGVSVKSLSLSSSGA